MPKAGTGKPPRLQGATELPRSVPAGHAAATRTPVWRDPVMLGLAGVAVGGAAVLGLWSGGPEQLRIRAMVTQVPVAGLWVAMALLDSH